MPALIDSIALRGEPAWHGLGTVFPQDQEVTTDEMITLAGLDWTVSLEEITTATDGLIVPGFAVVRNNTDGTRIPLGIVGEKYRTVQNRDALGCADNIADGGAKWETAGALKQGEVVFGSLKFERDFVLDPNGASDEQRSYILVATSHDGSLAVNFITTNVRVLCSNTLNAALRGAKVAYRIRHTQSVDGKILAARQALGLSHAYMDAFEAEAATLYETAVTDAKFEEIVSALYPKPDEESKAATTRWNNKRERIMSVWHGPTVENIYGTAWGAWNAITEDNQWHRNVRGGNLENALAAGAGFDQVTNEFRTRSLEVVKALA